MNWFTNREKSTLANIIYCPLNPRNALQPRAKYIDSYLQDPVLLAQTRTQPRQQNIEIPTAMIYKDFSFSGW